MDDNGPMAGRLSHRPEIFHTKSKSLTTHYVEEVHLEEVTMDEFDTDLDRIRPAAKLKKQESLKKDKAKAQ